MCASKIPLGVNVLAASEKRISDTFDNFERIYVSFSAGKDSTVMLHLVAKEARKRSKRIGLLLVDLEAQYKLTIEHALNVFEEYKDIIDPYWISLPLHLRNAVSVYEPQWVCWEKDKRDLWIREPPPYAITSENFFPFFVHAMEFEEFVPEFGEWYAQGKSCACFVGIRSDESLNRYRTIASKSKERFKDYIWTTKVTQNTYNIYPIYDWKTEDLWTWHAKNPDKSYNELYDRMHLAGLSLSQMRICQPYGDDQRRGLWLFHLIEPETWAKIVYRVNGANGGALYIKEWGNINGYRTVNKPPAHTWQSFSEMLIESMPPQTREHFKAKVFVFQEWWKKKGYPDGIPDEADYHLEVKRLVPSWRRVCKSLLRNDYWCKGLSFTQHKTDAYKKYLARIKTKIDAEEKAKRAQTQFEELGEYSELRG
jgi:predicted phosphoadenosine phosphosulfate sulfurtransferase